MDVRNVAVIGAGISGIVSARYLTEAGLSVTVFERSGSLGGIWVYNEQPGPEPPFPNDVPSFAESVPNTLDRTSNTSDLSNADIRMWHAPPSPAYASLRNNIPTCLMSFRDYQWPENCPDYIARAAVLDHVCGYARAHDVERLVRLHTRVTHLARRDSDWVVETSTLLTKGDEVQHDAQTHHFDAVVIAAGHHSACRVPDIRGLAELKRAWPSRIWHSKSYRHVEDIVGRNIVLVGNGATAFDIAHELKGRVDKLYQVVRPNSMNIPVEFMPSVVERVAEIAHIEITDGSKESTEGGEEAKTLHPLPARIHLTDGRLLTDIDSIVLCTGYMYSYPFLKQYHDDVAKPEGANNTTLITDGSMLHNLHRDMFYIPQPTLSFVSVQTGATSLALNEYHALAIASVYTGRTHLPSQAAMEADHRHRVSKGNVGRKFHSVMGKEVDFIESLVAWLNEGRPQDDQLQGLSEAWLNALAKRTKWLKEVFKKDGSPSKLSWDNIPPVCGANAGSYFEVKT